jgi:hypothetical protein
VDNTSTEFTFHFDLSIPNEDRNTLLGELSAPDVSAQLAMYGAGPMEEVMAAVTIISTAISMGQIAKLFANKVIQWRNRMRQKGISTRLRIERPGTGSINLEIDDDETVVVFITKQLISTQQIGQHEEIQSADTSHEQE